MNNFERKEMIDDLTNQFTKRELAGMLIDAKQNTKQIGKVNCEIKVTFDDLLKNMPDLVNKIKAEGVRDAAEALYISDLSCGRQSDSEYEINYFRAYANNLEKGA